MIGIDITKVSRFNSITLPRLIRRLNVDGDSPLAAAKTWACLEALVKAEGKPFDYAAVKILFPRDHAPVIVDEQAELSHQYMLSLSHEDDLVVAVAIRLRLTRR